MRDRAPSPQQGRGSRRNEEKERETKKEEGREAVAMLGTG
jgi:hypothetical protein